MAGYQRQTRSMFADLNASIAGNPINARGPGTPEGMPYNPQDNVNPYMNMMAKGVGGLVGTDPMLNQTTGERMMESNAASAEAMTSEDPEMLRQAASLMMKQGRVQEAQQLIQRADQIKNAKLDAGKEMLDEGAADIEAKLQSARETQNLMKSIAMSKNFGDSDWTKMLQSGQAKPSDYFEFLKETKQALRKEKDKKSLEDVTTEVRYSYEYKDGVWFKIDSLSESPPEPTTKVPAEALTYTVLKDAEGHRRGTVAIGPDGKTYMKDLAGNPIDPEAEAAKNEAARDIQSQYKLMEQISRLEYLQLPENRVSYTDAAIQMALPEGVPKFGKLPNLLNVLKEVNANLTFNELKDLKATGATLGAVAKAEFEALGSAFAKLDPADPEFYAKLAKAEEGMRRAADFQSSKNPADLFNLNSAASRDRVVSLGKGDIKIVASADGHWYIVTKADEEGGENKIHKSRQMHTPAGGQ